MVYDFGSQHSYVQTPLVRVGTRVVFSAIGPMGVEPWVTDGTSQGTSVLRDVHPGATGSDATAYTPIGALAVFRADDGIHGAELWRTDGTAAGTTLLKDIATGPRGSEISWLTPHAGVVYFCAQGVDGAELWRTDGTAAGTVQAVDIEPFGSSHPAQLVSVGRRYLWFSAWTHRYGRELWRSDGSAAGTRRFSDIMPGERDSLLGRVEPIVAFDNRLLFIAEAPLAGRELHAVFDLHAIARRSGAGCGAGGAVPQLTAADPVQGQPLQLDLDAAPAGRAGMLLLGLPMPGGHLGGGCTLFVDPAVAVAHPFRTDAAGRWQLGNTIIPNLPILRGVTVAAQVGVDSPATAPLGVALSGGWRLTIDPK
jgi:ELWxxDGT repeat protein